MTLLYLTAIVHVFVFRLCLMVAQFIISGSVYFLLLLLTLGEEFKHCPAPLQSLCCWVHETKYARTVLMLTAISVNFVIASVNVVSQPSTMPPCWVQGCWEMLFPASTLSALV